MATTVSPFGGTVVPSEYSAVVLSAAERWGVPPALLAAQINQESGFNPNALSPDGAIGIAQFMPGTAKSVGLNPHDPMASIDAMAKLMAHYKKKYGSWQKALLAYHGGEGAVDNPGPKSVDYATKILGKVGAAIDLVSNVANPLVPDQLEEVTKLLKNLRDPAWLKRVGTGVLGAFLILIGAFLLFGPSLGTVTKAVSSRGTSLARGSKGEE